MSSSMKQAPSTPDEIASFVKTASIDDIMRVATQMRATVEALRKQEDKLQKKLDKEAERKERQRIREEEKFERRMKKQEVTTFEQEEQEPRESVGSNDAPPKKRAGRPPKEKKERKPRAPTAYNLFLKDKLIELAIKFPDMDTRDRMKQAGEEWRRKKCA